MAVVTRWFSTVAAGAGDGTSWANRAALFSAGNWSSVITGFAFNAGDALEARVGPGNYTSTQNLVPGLFANPPTILNPIVIRACDSSGSNWVPPSPSWLSCTPTWDTTNMPVITCGTTTTARAMDLSNAVVIGLSWRPGPSGHFQTLVNGGAFHWNYFLLNVGGNQGIGGATNAFWNCSTLVTANIGSGGAGGMEGSAFNCRCESTNAGNTGPGMIVQGGSFFNCTSIGWLNPFSQANTHNAFTISLNNCVGVARSAAGTEGLRHFTTSATARSRIVKSLISEAVTGVMATTSPNVEIFASAFNNVATPIGYSTNMLMDYVTLSESLTDLFVDPASGDYRIKTTSSLWGKNIGAGDEPSSGSLILPSVSAWAY